MRKFVLLCLSLVVGTIFVLAQSPKPPSASNPNTPANRKALPKTQKQNLSDDFAKAGLKALRGVESTLGVPSEQGGAIAVPRQPQELIDNTDAEARTEEEKSIVAALNSFYLGRLINNLERDNLLLEVGTYSEESRARGQAEMEKNPRVLEMKSREAACSNLLDDILRSRHYTEKPALCYEVNPPKDTTAKNK
jgi:hypothetical protein